LPYYKKWKTGRKGCGKMAETNHRNKEIKNETAKETEINRGVERKIDPGEIETVEKGEDIEDKAEEKKEVENDDRNLKEKIYDKIPISLKALDILIVVLISVFVFMMLYFVLRKFMP
jgi:hypothetical protein